MSKQTLMRNVSNYWGKEERYMDIGMLKNTRDVIRCLEEDVEDEMYLELQWEGEFPGKCRPELIVYNYSEDKRLELEMTLNLILNSFERIYNNSLKAMLPVLVKWGFHSSIEDEIVVKTLKELHKARYPEDFIDLIQIDCADIKEDFCYYSFIFRVDYTKYGYDDGMEIVCFKDKVIFWGDGNTREYIFEFRGHKGEITYIGE